MTLQEQILALAQEGEQEITSRKMTLSLEVEQAKITVAGMVSRTKIKIDELLGAELKKTVADWDAREEERKTMWETRREQVNNARLDALADQLLAALTEVKCRD